jgi:hypothetical protein
MRRKLLRPNLKLTLRKEKPLLNKGKRPRKPLKKLKQPTKLNWLLEPTQPPKLEPQWLQNIRLNLKSKWLKHLRSKRQLLKNKIKNKLNFEKRKLIRNLELRQFY